jgi:hypothetical protein
MFPARLAECERKDNGGAQALRARAARVLARRPGAAAREAKLLV